MEWRPKRNYTNRYGQMWFARIRYGTKCLNRNVGGKRNFNVQKWKWKKIDFVRFVYWIGCISGLVEHKYAYECNVTSFYFALYTFFPPLFSLSSWNIWIITVRTIHVLDMRFFALFFCIHFHFLRLFTHIYTNKSAGPMKFVIKC